MKYILIALLLALDPIITSAQSHNVFADVGLPGGFSLTYNYRYLNHFGVGLGVQGYNFSPTNKSSEQFVPAVFADFRFYHEKAKHMFFYLIDLGFDFYSFDKVETTTQKLYSANNGLYFGFGVGYFRPMTKWGGGPYLSLKFISNSSTIDQYYVPTREHSKYFNLHGTFALSIGFKL